MILRVNQISTRKKSGRIQMNMLFQTNNERKRRIFDKSIQKDMIIPFEIYHTNKEFPVTVQPKNARRLKFSDNLWQTWSILFIR